MDTPKNAPRSTDQPATPPPPSGCFRTSLSGFLITLALIGLYLTIHPPSCAYLVRSSRAMQDADTAANLINAIALYEIDHGHLPAPAGSPTVDLPSDARLIDILTGHDATHNPRRRSYFEGRPARQARGNAPVRGGLVDLGGGSLELLDSSGNHYYLRLDYDGDGLITPPDSSSPVKARAICWSYGPPPDPDEPGSSLRNPPEDWITSWR